MYRFVNEDTLQVLIVHPGGPAWKNRDVGAWSIPKGELAPGDDVLRTALREFAEELGSQISGEFTRLKSVRQRGGKLVHAFAVEGDFDTDRVVSNTVTTEWPPRSGRRLEIPEIDRAEWFEISAARAKLNPAQVAFLDELIAWLR